MNESNAECMSNVGTTENFTGSTSLLGLKVAVQQWM